MYLNRSPLLTTIKNRLKYQNPNDWKSRVGNRFIKGRMGWLILAAILGTSVSTRAQDSEELLTKPFQFTLLHPLGTDGSESPNYNYNFSLNLVTGRCGGIDGTEFSGVLGITENNVSGTQFSGFLNIVKGNVDGIQLSGFTNITNGVAKGGQLAGFFNYAQTFRNGVQGSGFVNYTDNNQGLQMAGFANFARQGNNSQISGFLNSNAGDITGIQGSGFANMNRGKTRGIQMAGFANVNTDSIDGLQMSGFANITSAPVKGAQISGFLNVASTLDGVQLGIINYADSVKNGVPIGLISIVKDGYQAFEIATTETLHGTISFKTGTRQFYNILSVGASLKNDQILWGWGYGVGTLRSLNSKNDLALELSSFHINEDEWHTDELNLHNKLRIKWHHKVSESLDIFGGVSWNVNVRDVEKAPDMTIAPWELFDKTYSDDTNVKMYPGFSAGIVF